MDANALRRRRGLTLVELLVVILIVGLISVVALPTVIPAIQHRQVSEAARILQGALAGARDKAIRDGQPSGIRLLPDPAFPLSRLADGTIDPSSVLAYNRIVPIGPAPEYAEGYVLTLPSDEVPVLFLDQKFYFPVPSLRVRWSTLRQLANGQIANLPPQLYLIGQPVHSGAGNPPNPPTSWFWNVRVGDKVQVNGSGPWYTITGPMGVGPAAGNGEMFVNAGPPAPLNTLPVPHVNGVATEYLTLVNGRDDDGNGWSDEGWDGVDNNGNGLTDEFQPGVFDTINGFRVERKEWETEGWLGTLASRPAVDATYVIRRRPMPSPNAREVALPTQMVVDATTIFSTAERSRLPVDRFTGFVDILLNPDGTVAYNSPYGSPSSFGMADTFYHFWLSERQDVAAPTGTTAPLLPIAEPGGRSNKVFAGQVIKGEWALLTLFTRTGRVVSVEGPPFDNPLAVTKNRPFNVNLPYIGSQQGVR